MTRQFSTRNGDGFGWPHSLTLGHELVRRQVTERAVWPMLIVVQAPRFDLDLRVPDLNERPTAPTGLSLLTCGSLPQRSGDSAERATVRSPPFPGGRDSRSPSSPPAEASARQG